MSATMITVQTTVKKPVAAVWPLYNEPTHVVIWNTPSEDWHTPAAVNDLSINGKFSYRMEAKNGIYGFDFSGVYTEVIEHELIAYTLDDGRKVTIEFKPIGDSTKITVDFEAETQNSVDMQKEGWQAILDNFCAYAERYQL